MPVNSKAELLSLRGKEFKDIMIDGLKKPLRLGVLSAADRAALVGKLGADGNPIDDVDPIEFQVTLVSKSVVDENGSRIFKDEDRDDILSLPGKLLDVITKEALNLNALNPEAVEEEVENFDGAQKDDSSSC